MHWSIICQRAKQSGGARPQAEGQVALEQTFLLGPLPCQLARAAHGLSLFTGPAFRRLFKILPHFHFAEDAFTLQFLFQGAKRLIDIIVANTDLYQWSSPSKFAAFRETRRIAHYVGRFNDIFPGRKNRTHITFRQALPAD